MSSRDKIHVLSRAVIVDRGQILLCKTRSLKTNFYFLPGGHIENGESVRSSLIRELKEETGFECTIKRFLGCLEYSFVPGHSSICHNHEYNFIFEAESSALTSNETMVCEEDNIELMWKPLDQLSKLDFRAEPLQKLIPHWLAKKEDSDIFASEMVPQTVSDV
ncbi:DNA mismatch repair protein MutT [Candidatus Aerophobetes bacterium]|uniref:DNA mismatch repair protein MutT n=1 Tax=Aerophobetes bacterium TaxID=2030807 RepID=A0A2A4WYK5_UNCAE|nr:MAG: DNA mismatch repair protein MutT [Candidatus Aerophobetes bacterium]